MLVRLPTGTWIDPTLVVTIRVAERSDEFPAIQERALLDLSNGSVIVIPFPSTREAQAWTDEFAARINGPPPQAGDALSELRDSCAEAIAELIGMGFDPRCAPIRNLKDTLDRAEQVG